MNTTPLKMVVIVSEPVLEPRLVSELQALGATGCTIVDGRGEGSRHGHATDVPGANVRIETIVRPEVADRIMEHVSREYFAHYSFIAYVVDVAVARGAKYGEAERFRGQPD
jgi:nitrogen regulatory protein P-II 2